MGSRPWAIAPLGMAAARAVHVFVIACLEGSRSSKPSPLHKAFTTLLRMLRRGNRCARISGPLSERRSRPPPCAALTDPFADARGSADARRRLADHRMLLAQRERPAVAVPALGFVVLRKPATLGWILIEC